MDRTKNLILISVIFTALFIIITGCGSGKEKVAQAGTNGGKDVVSAADIKDMAAIYEVVKGEIGELKREIFDTWEVKYFDLTGDGTDEAVFAAPYGAEWHNKLEVVSGETGEYKRIDSDIYLGKYGTIVDFKDGFLTVKADNGGTGEHFTELELYVFDGSAMKKALDGLVISHTVAFPDADFEETGNIEGSLTDFIYTLTKLDNKTNKESVVKKIQYTYDADRMEFAEKPSVTGSQASVAQTGQKNDITKGYTFKVGSGSLKLTYKNTGNTVTLVEENKIYNFIKEGSTMQNKSTVLSARTEGNRLYFTVKAPDYSVGEVTYYVDLNTLKIYWVGTGTQSSNDVTEESESDKLTGLENETVNGVKVNYNEYCTVIIPAYNGKNISKLKEAYMDLGSVTQGTLTLDAQFVVFGYLKDVKMTFYENMQSKGEAVQEASFYNAVVGTRVWLPSGDASYIKVTGKAPTADGGLKSIEFTLDDMREPTDYKPILVK